MTPTIRTDNFVVYPNDQKQAWDVCRTSDDTVFVRLSYANFDAAARDKAVALMDKAYKAGYRAGREDLVATVMETVAADADR